MSDHPVAEASPLRLWDEWEQIALDFVAVLLGGESEPLTQSHDMRIDDDSGLDREGVSEYDVGCLAGDSGELEQIFHAIRNSAAEPFHDRLAGPLNAAGFVAVKVDPRDVSFEFGKIRDRIILGTLVLLEQIDGNFVDERIRALC